jgi:hypothetical protein
LIYYGLSAAVPFTENAISLSSGFWVGFHKPLALLFFGKSLNATASAAILWRYWSFFPVHERESWQSGFRGRCWQTKVLDSVVWGGEQEDAVT